MSEQGPAHGTEEQAPPKLRRNSGGGTELPKELNINSLLDVLSVILFFLLMGYTSSAVNIKPSPELQVPFTFSKEFAQQSTAVTLTRTNIMINDKPVLSIENGKTAEQDLSEAGLLIVPLANYLKEEVSHLKKIEQKNPDAKFNGLITIIADRNTPAKLLTQVMYTAGQSEFGTFNFALIKLEN